MADEWLEQHRQAARKRWGGSATPFRIGYLVGETGIGVREPCPYPNPRGQACYEDGIRAGIKAARRARLLARRGRDNAK